MPGRNLHSDIEAMRAKGHLVGHINHALNPTPTEPTETTPEMPSNFGHIVVFEQNSGECTWVAYPGLPEKRLKTPLGTSYGNDMMARCYSIEEAKRRGIKFLEGLWLKEHKSQRTFDASGYQISDTHHHGASVTATANPEQAWNDIIDAVLLAEPSPEDDAWLETTFMREIRERDATIVPASLPEPPETEETVKQDMSWVTPPPDYAKTGANTSLPQ